MVLNQTLPSGEVTQSYSTTLLGSGGTPPYTFAVTVGQLPTGLAINGGTLSGSPTLAGWYAFTIELQDSGTPPATASKALSLLVDPRQMHNFDGATAGDWFGQSLDVAGDVNNDGFLDLIVGSHLADNNGTDSGSATVFSGVDGSVIYTFDGSAAGMEFGRTVSGVGDVNLDGYADVVVGGPRAASDTGTAVVFSGIDGSVLHTFVGDSAGDEFGRTVGAAGDVNSDGYPDVIVGAPLDDNNGTDSGSARVFSGLDGSVLYTFDGDSNADSFGYSVGGAGDVNADGYADLIVGAPFDDNNGMDSGSARVLSGIDGATLYTFGGDGAGDRFGTSVALAGDVNADTYPDLIVGAPSDDDNGAEAGSARILSGLNGSVLYTFHGDSAGDQLGHSVSGAGDIDGDGNADVIVGAPGDDDNGSDAGSIRTFSGIDGSVIYTFHGDSADDRFGWGVRGAGDIVTDGYSYLLVSAPNDDNTGADAGSVRVFSGT